MNPNAFIDIKHINIANIATKSSILIALILIGLWLSCCLTNAYADTTRQYTELIDCKSIAQDTLVLTVNQVVYSISSVKVMIDGVDTKVVTLLMNDTSSSNKSIAIKFQSVPPLSSTIDIIGIVTRYPLEPIRLKNVESNWVNIFGNIYTSAYELGRSAGEIQGKTKASSDVISNLRWNGLDYEIDYSSLPTSSNRSAYYGYTQGYKDGFRLSYYTTYSSQVTINQNTSNTNDYSENDKINNDSDYTYKTEAEKALEDMQNTLLDLGKTDGEYYGNILGVKEALRDIEEGKPMDMAITTEYLMRQLPNTNYNNEHYIKGVRSSIYAVFYDKYIEIHRALASGEKTIEDIKYSLMTDEEKHQIDVQKQLEQEVLSKLETENERQQEVYLKELENQEQERLKTQAEFLLQPMGNTIEIGGLTILAETGTVYFDNQILVSYFKDTSIDTNGVIASNSYQLKADNVRLYQPLKCDLVYVGKNLPCVFYSVDNGGTWIFTSSTYQNNSVSFNIDVPIIQDTIRIVIIAHPEYDKLSQIDAWLLNYLCKDIKDIKSMDLNTLSANATYGQALDLAYSLLTNSEKEGWYTSSINYINLNDLDFATQMKIKATHKSKLNVFGNTDAVNLLLPFTYEDLSNISTRFPLEECLGELIWSAHISNYWIDKNGNPSIKEILYCMLRNHDSIERLDSNWLQKLLQANKPYADAYNKIKLNEEFYN